MTNLASKCTEQRIAEAASLYVPSQNRKHAEVHALKALYLSLQDVVQARANPSTKL